MKYAAMGCRFGVRMGLTMRSNGYPNNLRTLRSNPPILRNYTQLQERPEHQHTGPRDKHTVVLDPFTDC